MITRTRKGLLLISKHQNTQLSADIAIEETDEDKSLITGEVLLGSDQFRAGETVIFGKYAILKLKLKGDDYYFLDEEDVIGVADYRE